MSRERARISILSEMLSYPAARFRDWTNSMFSDSDVIEGDLVSLSSAPDTKWYLSWVREYDPNNGWPKYLLESIEDGELCWWENVGINIYNRERVAERPTWKWDDDQFAFNDRWKRVCYKRHDAYIILPMLPVFNGNDVTLAVRTRFGLSDYHSPRTFSNWKKLTMKAMSGFYQECEQGYEAYRETISRLEQP